VGLLADIATLVASVHRLTEAEKALSRHGVEMRAAHEALRADIATLSERIARIEQRLDDHAAMTTATAREAAAGAVAGALAALGERLVRLEMAAPPPPPASSRRRTLPPPGEE
jgi:phage shock protein A